MNGKEEKIVDKLLHLVKGLFLNIELKMKCLEVLGSLIYKGYGPYIEYLCQTQNGKGFFEYIIDAINRT